MGVEKENARRMEVQASDYGSGNENGDGDGDADGNRSGNGNRNGMGMEIELDWGKPGRQNRVGLRRDGPGKVEEGGEDLLLNGLSG